MNATQHSLNLTPEDRPKWFEHNVYNALNTADEYVWCYSEHMWCYSEHMDWWKGTVPLGLHRSHRVGPRQD